MGSGWILGREWQFYSTDQGACPVQKELDKCRLTNAELVKLRTLMARVQRRATLPGDVKSLGEGLLEVRLDGNRRIFRLIYAEEHGGLVLLGLTFFQKKTQSTPSSAKRAASKRLKDWRKRVTEE